MYIITPVTYCKNDKVLYRNLKSIQLYKNYKTKKILKNLQTKTKKVLKISYIQKKKTTC